MIEGITAIIGAIAFIFAIEFIASKMFK